MQSSTKSWMRQFSYRKFVNLPVRSTGFINMDNQNLNFGQAIEAAKQGKIVARIGWNGKGMFVYLNRGSSPNENPSIEGVSGDLFDLGDTDTVIRLPNLNMRSATGSTVTGWLASQTDILAEDWVILD